MEKKRENRRKDYAIPVLFTVAVILVFASSFITLVVRKNNGPSVKDGATVNEVEEYAYQLLASDNGTNTIGHDEAVAYYQDQINNSENAEQQFNLRRDLAVFFGKTGDPVSGLHVLDEIDAEDIPKDARYYLYSTYIYLYGRQGNDGLVAEYRQMIVDEGL